jgi:hypothetical protein
MLHGASVFHYCSGVGWRYLDDRRRLACQSVMVDVLWFSFESALGYGMAGTSRRDTVCERCMAMVLRAGMAWSMVPGLVLFLSTLFP